MLAELLLEPIHVGLGLVDLVDDDDDGDAGGLGVGDGLDGLGHHPVVGGHHDGGDIGDLGAAGAHGGERGVAGRVDERHELAVVLHLVGADMLRDAAGLAGRNGGVADRVEQARLAVVDVAHDGDDGGARLEVLGIVDGLGLELGLFVGGVRDLDLTSEVGGEDLDGLVAERLRDGDHLAVAHERLDDLGRGHAQQLRDVLDGGARRHLDQAGGHHGRRRLLVAVVTAAATAAPAAAALRAAAAARGARVDDHAAALAARASGPAPHAARRGRVRLLDGFVVDGDLAVDDLDARLLEVGEHVIDARLSLGCDIGDLALRRHSPHRLSSLVCRATARRTAGSRTTGPRKARANARRLSAASRHVCSGHR